MKAATRSLTAHVSRGDLTQFAIGEIHQARFGLRIALPEGTEKTGYVAISLALHFGFRHRDLLLRCFRVARPVNIILAFQSGVPGWLSVASRF